MRVIAILTTFLLLATAVHADVYIKAKTLSGDSETWTSEKKQRVDVMVPGFGKMSTVTRVDKGVEWQIDVHRGIYEEHPIAMPVTKEELSEMQTAAQSESLKTSDDLSSARGKIGSLQVLPEKREFLGASATGYRWAPDDSGTVVWLLPSKGVFAKAENENNEYQKSYLEALYSNYSQKDRDEMVKTMQTIGAEVGKSFAAYSGMGGIPKGLVVGFESAVGSADGGPPRSMMVFEMTELNLDPVDGPIFELPQGMRRVNDLAEEQARQMMGPGYAATMQSMQQIPQAQSEEEAGAAMAATMGNALATFDSPQMQEMMEQGADVVEESQEYE